MNPKRPCAAGGLALSTKPSRLFSPEQSSSERRRFQSSWSYNLMCHLIEILFNLVTEVTDSHGGAGGAH